MNRVLLVLSMCLLTSGSALAGASRPVGPVKPVKIVNDVINVRGAVDATVTGPIGVDVLTLPPGAGEGPVEDVESIRLECVIIAGVAANCAHVADTFPPGATRMLVYGVYGAISHTEAGGGVGGIPGGLCEGTLQTGNVIIGTWEVLPEQTQVISREFPRPLAQPVSATLGIGSNRTRGGSCLASVEVLVSFET